MPPLTPETIDLGARVSPSLSFSEVLADVQGPGDGKKYFPGSTDFQN